jgi:hypothetical protein
MAAQVMTSIYLLSEWQSLNTAYISIILVEIVISLTPIVNHHSRACNCENTVDDSKTSPSSFSLALYEPVK